MKVHFALSASTLQHVRSGAVRVLAITTEKRLEALPDVPTIAELGYPEFEIRSWQAMFAPAGTPKEVIGKLNAETAQLLATPEVRARIHKRAPIRSQFAGQFDKRIRNEVAKWERWRRRRPRPK